MVYNENAPSGYYDTKSQNKMRIRINGIELPSYSDYSYIDVKSYFTEPVRSALGVINNLNSYATFLTPKLKFSFKAMPIGAYRILMQLIKDYNEFTVEAYDIVSDSYVIRKMYFSPKDYPNIFNYGYEVLRIREEEFELIGTNADIDELSLVYHSNPDNGGQLTSFEGTDITSGLTFYANQEIKVGDYDIGVEGNTDPLSFTNTGYRIDSWNTKADGTGTTYPTGAILNNQINSFVLYARWISTNIYTIFFNYEGGSSSDNVSSKEITAGGTYGDLPTPTKNGYTFEGWFTLPNGEGTQITSSTIFNKDYNETLYAYWEGVTVTVTFNPNYEGLQEYSINGIVGETTTLSLFPYSNDRPGYQFIGWATSSDSSTVSIKDGGDLVFPVTNTTYYAVWKQAYTLTYHTNGGTNNLYQEVAYTVDKPIYTEYESHKLVGWYKDSNLTQMVTFPLTIEENTDIYARWN